jgi:excisionase family DNA binding protein
MTPPVVVHSGSAAADPSEPITTMRNDPEIPRLVGVPEAAEILGVVRQRVWQMIEEGKLPVARVGQRTFVLREQVVLEYKALLDLERQPK